MGRGTVGILTTNHFQPDGQRMIHGGAERYGIELSKLLVELGFQVKWWQIGSGWIREIIPGVPIISVPVQESPLQTFPQLNQIFYQQAMDCDYAIYFVTFLAYPQALPKSISISHGIFWDYPDFDNLLPTEEVRQEWQRRLWIALTGVERVVSVDTATINWATATWPGLVHKFAYLPNFVDLEQFKEQVERPRSGRLRVLFPRRLTSVRGVNEAVRAAEVLTRRYPDLEFHFVGRGHEDRAEQDLWQWAARHDRVYYYWVPPHRMPHLYRNVDIVLIPSKSTEGTSLSCLEAMAAGTAVVSTWVGGLGNLVIDGFDGLLVEPTAKDLIRAIERLRAHPQLRRRLGANARKVARHFGLTEWKKRWKTVLNEVFVG
jgi:glycosyltransferase involved in cell wall biosynthesis